MTALALPTFAMPFGSPRRDTVRWGLCFAAVIAAHVGITWAVLHERPREIEFGLDVPSVILDLPPGPKQEEVEETPPAPEEQVKQPETEAEVALPEPPKPEPPREQKLASAPPPAAVVRNWESLLVAHIERFK